MRIFAFVFFAFISTVTFAQTEAKYGFADWETILLKMPETKQIENNLKIHSDQLKAQLDAKYKEYEAKYKAYQAGGATMLDAVRQDKEAELTQMQQNIQKFQQDAQTSMQKKQNDLMEPVFVKISKAIKEVSKEHGFTFVFTAKSLGGEDILLYSDEKYDISPLVLKKFGILPTTTAATK
ncbi:MAG: OmpH family outer membrane protein [Cyclobacteriaceae bacterium]|nr:OmpH family outer membrane protein [Cyclobacteriaceae bacterium]